MASHGPGASAGAPAFLIVRVGERALALPIDGVREVRLPVPLLRTSEAPAFSDGVFRVKRLHVPVLDLRRRLGAQMETDHDAAERLVLVAVEGFVLGVVVDEVHRVVHAASASPSGDIPFRRRPDADLEHASVVRPEQLLSDDERAELRSRMPAAGAREHHAR